MAKVTVVPNCIDTARFHPEAKVPGMVTTVCRLSPEKNVAAIIRACLCLPWTRLHIVGDGPERVNLRCLASEYGVPAVFHGALSNDDVADLLARSEFFILASAYDQAPKVILEAMASGCYVIASHGAGIDVQHGVTGYLCDPTPKSILAALEGARGAFQRQSVMRAAREWAVNHRDLAVAVAAEREVICRR